MAHIKLKWFVATDSIELEPTCSLARTDLMPETVNRTLQLQQFIQRLNEGDEFARGELLSMASDRLLRITRRILHDFPGVARWEQTDDVFQRAAMRLYQAMADVKIQDVQHFFRLASLQIRRELIDLARHYQGPLGIGAKHGTQQPVKDMEAEGRSPAALDPAEMTYDPGQIMQWRDFHQRVEQLPQELRDVFDLLWYHELSQDEAAEILNVNVRTVRRRWRAARLALHDVIVGMDRADGDASSKS